MYQLTEKEYSDNICDVYSFCASGEINKNILELHIINKKYLLPSYGQEYIFEKEKTLAINLWDKIILFSLETGEILFCGGMQDAFVGIESTYMDYIIVTETTVSKLNKSMNYIYEFLSFPYIIAGYKLSKSSLRIKFIEEENEDDVIINL